MGLLVTGLIVFLGLHSIRIFAEDWRTRTIAKVGDKTWKGVYSLISLVGFALIVWGFSIAREEPVFVWAPPVGMRHLASLLTLIAFVLLAATYVPGNSIKARLHHPMVLSVKVWALSHILANGNLAHILLFGGFLVWAVLCFRAARKRDRAANTVYPAGKLPATVATLLVGVFAWAGFAMWAHGVLIGVRPF
jgi:uncharacterized membrane protein